MPVVALAVIPLIKPRGPCPLGVLKSIQSSAAVPHPVSAHEGPVLGNGRPNQRRTIKCRRRFTHAVYRFLSVHAFLPARLNRA